MEHSKRQVTRVDVSGNHINGRNVNIGVGNEIIENAFDLESDMPELAAELHRAEGEIDDLGGDGPSQLRSEIDEIRRSSSQSGLQQALSQFLNGTAASVLGAATLTALSKFV